MDRSPDTMAFSLLLSASDEPLFEWDIANDRLAMGRGLAKTLNLASPPQTMAAFYKLLPPDAATELAAMRKNLLQGQSGASPNYAYLCNGFWVQEYLLVLSRNSEGHATRVLGKIDATPVGPAQAGFGFNSAMDNLAGCGVWIYDVKKGQVWQDQTCCLLLGARGRKFPQPASKILRDIHPAERAALQRHYRTFCASSFFGDTITDLVRMKVEDGTYAPMLLRACAVQRNEAGKALLVAGLLAPGEPASADCNYIYQDDSLFHALNNMGGGQWTWNVMDDTLYFSPRYLDLLGYASEPNPMSPQTWRAWIHPEDAQKVAEVQEEILASPKSGNTFEYAYRLKGPEGEWTWIFDRGYVTWRDKQGRAGHIIGSITNINAAQAERDRLEDLVRHDALTGLRSRAFCNLEIEHIEQNAIRPVCIISVDISGLKMINDSLGHSMGDTALTRAATLLRDGLRKTDCVARIGGDEFLAILPNCKLEKGKKLLSIIRERFDEYNSQPDVMPVFASLGLACARQPQERLRDVIERADEAMYENKKAERHTAHAALRAWIVERTGEEPAADDRLD